MAAECQILWFSQIVFVILITKVFDKQLGIKSSDIIKEWRFDRSMPSFSNSNKIRYGSSLYSECTCEGLSAYDYFLRDKNNRRITIKIPSVMRLNCQIKSFALMESDWMLSVGFLFLMRSISWIKQSSFWLHFLRIVNWSWRSLFLRLCMSCRCLAMTECLGSLMC